MAVPQMTDQQRAAALVKAHAARRARLDLKDRLKRGAITLNQALTEAATNEVIGKTRVFEVLAALPRIGTIKAQQIMTEVQIAPTRRLQGLTDRQRHALLDKFDPT